MHIELYKGWVVLTEEDQSNDYVKRMLEGDLSLPKPPHKEIPLPTPEQMVENLNTVFKQNPWLREAFQDAPALADIMCVQPTMSKPTGLTFFMDYVYGDTRKQKETVDMCKGLQDGEILKQYEFDYGDVLSMRGGYFVVHKDKPNKVLRYCQTRMS
jgi:hypothetical protein